MLIGEYYHNIDSKGRLSIPAKFRDDLGGTFVLSRGLDNCLYAYSVSEWNSFKDELLQMRGKDAQRIRRFFFSGATECEIDTQGRVVIPPGYREYASLEKEVAVVGVSNRAEIWSRSAWDKYINASDFDSGEIAKAMENMGF